MNVAIWSKEVTAETFTIEVSTRDGAAIGGVQAALQYDSSRLRLNSVTFLNGWSNLGDNATWVLNNPNLPGPGTIAQLSFTRIGNWADGATAAVSLTNVKMSDGTATVGAPNDTATVTYRAPVVQQPNPQPQPGNNTNPNPNPQPENEAPEINCEETPEAEACVTEAPEPTPEPTPETEQPGEVIEVQPSRLEEFLDSKWAYGAGGLALGVVATTLVFVIIMLARRGRQAGY